MLTAQPSVHVQHVQPKDATSLQELQRNWASAEMGELSDDLKVCLAGKPVAPVEVGRCWTDTGYDDFISCLSNAFPMLLIRWKSERSESENLLEE